MPDTYCCHMLGPPAAPLFTNPEQLFLPLHVRQSVHSTAGRSHDLPDVEGVGVARSHTRTYTGEVAGTIFNCYVTAVSIWHNLNYIIELQFLLFFLQVIVAL